MKTGESPFPRLFTTPAVETPTPGRTRPNGSDRWAAGFSLRALGYFALVVTVPLVLLGLTSTPAWASNVVNYTFHVPASVLTNPCFPADVVNLNGDIHVVITTTADNSGGYHTTNGLNSQLSGASITTGTKYVNSENQQDEWYASAPFPAVHTHTYDFVMVSASGTDNYVLHMTMHETVTAGGVPAATVDNYTMGCQG